MSTDAFLASVRSSLRRSLFQRLKPLGLSQDEVNRLVTQATSRAMALSNIADLAAIASVAGPVVAALETASPGNPALAGYNTVRENVREPVRELIEQQVEP